MAFDASIHLSIKSKALLKIENVGPQKQRFDYEQFAEQFRQQFAYALRK
jgi:hypothetical protein